MKIGSVTLDYIASGRADREYSDGSVEDYMLDIVKSPDYPKNIEKILADDPSWPIYYHFSPNRANLVNWYTLKRNSQVLEIGAGCGAITEALLSMSGDSTQIDALELSERRALINAYRNKAANNLNIIVGNLESLDSGKKYDHIICVGVLEYAGRFISGAEPFSQFLKTIRGLLKPDGELLLAIENKFGIKYINGAREDHLGKYYESLMSYPQYDGIKTFSRKELLGLFEVSGLEVDEFMFPIPDYKIPKLVISEDLLSKVADTSFLLRYSPAPALDQDRIYSMSEQLLTKSALDAGLYSELANSFLVRARV